MYHFLNSVRAGRLVWGENISRGQSPYVDKITRGKDLIKASRNSSKVIAEMKDSGNHFFAADIIGLCITNA